MRVRMSVAAVAAVALLGAGACGSSTSHKTPHSAPPASPSSTMATEQATLSPDPTSAAPVGPVLSDIVQLHVQQDWNANGRTIVPKAIVLHWWAGWGGGHDIDRLVRDSNQNMSTYNPDLKSTDPHPTVGHVTEQFGVLGDGEAFQLTPLPNTFARHAKCANSWAIGIEIEGSDRSSDHYIGDNETQLGSVVKLVKALMALYHIPAVSVVADDGRSGEGIVSHEMVDRQCKWADGVYAGGGKTDVDSAYLQRVLDAVS